MISIINRGQYRLIETTEKKRILILNNKDTFAWFNVGNAGEIIERFYGKIQEENTLAEGSYRLYHVHYEEKLTPEIHLELFVGEGKWQGYLLPEGLPVSTKKQEKQYPITPTKELITKVMVGEQFGASWL